ncbi:MAG: DUF3857 domain-containing protein [Bacteroidota bacterium]
MKKIALMLAFIVLVIAEPALAQTQEREFKNYTWENNPKLTNTDTDTSNNSVVIFSKNYYEYTYEKDILCEFETVHKRIKLITHLGIENNNKVYIPLYANSEIVTEKARVIKNDGSIRELNKDEIKEAYDQESGTKYRYFAFEGIEIGCEIEYIYCIKDIPSLSGTIFTIQLSIPVLSYEAKFIAPINLWFKFKSFNGCPDAVYDTTDNIRNVWMLNSDGIPRLKEEESSALKAEKMKFAVKLERNSFTGKKDIYSYGPLASDIYDRIFNNLDPKDTKAIASFVKQIKVDATSEESKIRSVENYLKTNFIYDDSDDPNKSMITKVLSTKAYNDFGSVKLFANIFKNLGIEQEIVITCDRFENKFPKDFECYVFLSKYLIYFPKIKKFMAPADNFTRLGFPDNSYIMNYGLFIKAVTVGDFSTGLGKIKFIDGAKYIESLDKLTIVAQITPDFSNTIFKISREMSGYDASYYQPFFDFIKDDDKLKEFSESIIKYIDKEGTIEELSFENKGGNFLGEKPLIAKATLKSDYFFEKAGNKYLFKAGMLIGPQLELYKKDERKLPLEFPYNHCYERTIVFNIPDGYKVSNLDQFKINEVYVRAGNDSTMAFTSDFKVVDTTVTVSIVEYYKEYTYTVAEFEDYRRVANASANFNKVVLVFEKK